MCPVYGRIAAGEPNWAEECLEGKIPIDPELLQIFRYSDSFLPNGGHILYSIAAHRFMNWGLRVVVMSIKLFSASLSRSEILNGMPLLCG